MTQSKIDEQKRLFKSAKGSLCKGCDNYDADCFNYDKSADTAKGTGVSLIVRCSGYKKKAEEGQKTILGAR